MRLRHTQSEQTPTVRPKVKIAQPLVGQDAKQYANIPVRKSV